MKKAVSVLLVLFALALSGCPTKPAAVEQKPLVVFLVRHAEKTDAGKDPELSEDGKTRAGVLAEVLRSAKIDHVYSTDFIRTRDTAAPVAKEAGVEVGKYDPKDLAGFAKKLKDAGGRVLVVGHSNTTPELTKLLGGDPGTEINEKGEYDRLYILTIGKDGTVNSALLRYGKRFDENADYEEKPGM